jgi:glycyl-tRNA synthetase
VIEPSFGAERILYAVLEYAYTRVEDRTVLKIPIDLVPVQLVILPLVAKDGLPEKAKELYELMRHEHFSVEYDDSGTIGRRYARSDEIGVPIAVTVDYQTLEDGTVTLRNRDSWKQFRADSAKLPEILRRYFAGNIAFEEMSQMLDDLKG